VAIVIDTHKSLRPLQNLPFCYLCGGALQGEDRDTDHVPPSTIFLKRDRDFPLVLPTHVSCNGGRSVEDQLVGTLIGVLHNKPAASGAKRLDLRGGPLTDGTNVVTVHNLDLRAIIRRWVRGFHAALYGEYVPDDVFMTVPPLPEGVSTTTGGEFEPAPPIVEEIVKRIRCNCA
jgi:hypothetical protein